MSKQDVSQIISNIDPTAVVRYSGCQRTFFVAHSRGTGKRIKEAVKSADFKFEVKMK